MNDYYIPRKIIRDHKLTEYSSDKLQNFFRGNCVHFSYKAPRCNADRSIDPP
jgi:hypothetical protein